MPNLPSTTRFSTPEAAESISSARSAPAAESATTAPASPPAASPDSLVRVSKKPTSWGPFLYKADAIPTAIVTTGVALSLAPFVVPMSAGALAALVPAAIACRLLVPVHQHGHSHLKVFKSSALNHVYDWVLMLGGGNITAGWEMQHCRGHHTMYLDHENDVAGSKRFTKTGKLRRLIYTVAGDAMSLVDSYRIAKTVKDPAAAKRKLTAQVAVQVATNAALIALDPTLALTCVILPNVFLRAIVFWKSFEQHDEAPAHDVYDGSINSTGKIQELLLNVGHHTAHHKKPTLHWSLLPQLTEEIRDKIPPECMR